MERFVKFLGPAGLVLTLVGGVTYGILSSSGWKALLPLVAGLVLVAAAAVVGWRNARSEGALRTARSGVNAAVAILALAAILVFLQTIVSRHSPRWDTTANKRFSLSAQTVRILDRLPRDVIFTCFFKEGAAGRQELSDQLRAFSAESPRIKYTFVDPDRDPVVARRYGLTRYNTIVVESGGSQEKIFDITEEKITNAILKVTRERRKTVYALTGHGERSLDDAAEGGLAQLKAAIAAESYDIKPLFLLRDTIPPDCSVLVIPGPEKDLFPPELRAIERYLAGGGNVLLLVDPMTEVPRLDTLAASYGIGITNTVIVDRFGKLLAGNYLTPVVNAYGRHPIAENFRMASFFPQARALSILPGKPAGTEVTMLASTGESAYAESDLAAVLKGKTQFDASVDRSGPVEVALVASKNPEPPAGGAAEKPRGSRMVVFGDCDFTTNANLALSGNKDLILNTIGWLAEESDLISIRARNPVSQPVILSMRQGRVVFWLPVVGLPAAFLLAGFLVVYHRRRSG